MKHIHQLALTQQQCQILSALARTRTPLDYVELRLLTDLSRPVLYAQAMRLVRKGYARRSRPLARNGRSRPVLHVITAAGRKARERYAGELGLRTETP